MRRPSLPKLPAIRRPSPPKLPRLRRAGGPTRPSSPQAAAKPKPVRKLPPLKLILPAAGAILIVVLLIGTCGTDQDKRVRDTLNRFAQASRDKDYQALCDELLSKSLVDQLRTADRPCEVVWRIGLRDVQNPTLEVLDVNVDGDKATARVDTGAAGQPSLRTKILLVQEDGNWRISSLPDEQQPAAAGP